MGYCWCDMDVMHGWRVLLMSPATEYNRKGDWIQIIAQQIKANKF